MGHLEVCQPRPWDETVRPDAEMPTFALHDLAAMKPTWAELPPLHA
jgi:hypothetical protein